MAGVSHLACPAPTRPRICRGLHIFGDVVPQILPLCTFWCDSCGKKSDLLKRFFFTFRNQYHYGFFSLETFPDTVGGRAAWFVPGPKPQMPSNTP